MFKRINTRKHNMVVSPEETFVDTRNLPGFDTTRFEGSLERPISGMVLYVLGGIFLLVSMFLMGRASYLTLYEGNAYALRAENNHFRHSTIVPERGAIYDRTGKPLAFNVPGFRVIVDTRGTNQDTVLPLVGDLAVLLERDISETVSLIERHWDTGEIVVDLIRDWDTANQIITYFKDSDSIRVEPTPLRAYDSHPAFFHVLGYVSRVTKEDIENDDSVLVWGEIGKSGIERMYDAVLRGALGIKIIESDSQGVVLSEGMYQYEEQGESLELSISADFQKILYEAIQDTVEERGFSGGSAVVLDAKSGEVISLVSYPGFNSNVFSSGSPYNEIERILSSDRYPLFNRAIAGLYPPASTIKPFLAAAAIEEGLVQKDTIINTNGRIVVPNPFNPDSPSIFKDWRNHGAITLLQAIAISSNVYFFSIGGGYENQKGLGHLRIQSYLNSFGLGSKTGIDILGEEQGVIPNEEWKAEHYPNDPLWRIGDTYNMSIGQGDLLVTPLQMARAVLAIARDGLILNPYLVTTRIQADGFKKEYHSSETIRYAAVSSESLVIAQEGMREAVLRGTAQGVSTISLPVAGKTGTAQASKRDRTHSWFVGFLPWDNPELVLAINLENGPEGNLVGATFVAHKVLSWYADKGRDIVYVE